MDMLKKARGKAMQAVKEVQKEVQGIIQTPGQQAASYSSSHSGAPYQQYGHQYPPQVQSFQSQYTAPSQSHPQMQNQHQYSAASPHPTSPYYPQYTQNHNPQQSPPIPQPYNHGQPPVQHGYQAQQQQQYAPPVNYQQPQTQGTHVHKLPPADIPPIQGFEGLAHPSHSHQNVVSPSSQQPSLSSPPFNAQYQSTRPQQYQQHVVSPSSGPQLSQSSMSPPPANFYNGSQGPPPQASNQQQGYFPSTTGHPFPSSTPASPQATSYQQPAHQNVTQQQGQPPPIPQGRPQTTSPPVYANPIPPPPGASHQQFNQGQNSSQPARYNTSPPPAFQPGPMQPQGPPPQQNVQHVAPQPAQPYHSQSSSPTGAQIRHNSQCQGVSMSPPTPIVSPQSEQHRHSISSPPLSSNHSFQQGLPSSHLQQAQSLVQAPPQQPEFGRESQATIGYPLASQDIPSPSNQPQFSPPYTQSIALTPAPLSVRPRPQSSVGIAEHTVTQPDKATLQNLPHRSPEKYISPSARPVDAGRPQVNPTTQSGVAQHTTSPVPIHIGVVDGSSGRTASNHTSPTYQGSSNGSQGPISPSSGSQYQWFIHSDQTPSNDTAVISGQNYSIDTDQGPPPPAAKVIPPIQAPQIEQNRHHESMQTEFSHYSAPSSSFTPDPNSWQDQTLGRISPKNSSPVQSVPQSSTPQGKPGDYAQISPQSTFASLDAHQDSPLSIHSVVDHQSKAQNKQHPLPANAVELPSAPYETQSLQKLANDRVSPQPKNNVLKQERIEYADGLMLADEDTTSLPVMRNAAARQQPSTTPISRKTACTVFEPTLTDTNQYFEMRPDFMEYHKIPRNEGGPFAICEFCFYTYLSPHPWLASLFHPRPKATRPTEISVPQISFEKMIGCGLAFPRIRQVILGQTIPTRNLQPFIDYAKIDAALVPCTGEPQGGPYYGSRAIESIAVCSSCFESYIKNTEFERHFSLQRLSSPDQQWACDIGYSGYVHRTLLQDIAQNPPNFGHFAYAANKRLAMSPCSGHKQPITCSGSNGSTIFRTVRDNCGVFCSGCFHDKVVGTSAEHNFGYEIEIDDDQKAALSCDLSFEFSKDAMDCAVKANNFDVWHAPIVANNTPRLCPSITGIDEGDFFGNSDEPTWYCFKDYPNIEVCGKCYGTRIVMYRAEELFLPITREPVPGRIRQCYLSPAKDMHSASWDPLEYANTTQWRGQYLRNVLHYCMDAGGDWSMVLQAAANIAALPPPCGSELRKFTRASGRKFFGHQSANANGNNDATITMCEECFHATAKGTPMESFFSNDLTNLAYQLSPDGHRCSTWSIQTKRRLRQACLSNSFASYAQYHHQREQVFEALWTSIRELVPLNELLKQHTANINRQTELNIQMGSLRLAQQMNNQMNATIMGIGGSFAEAAAPDYGMRYGNGTVGMDYLTPNGANAAMAQHQAAKLPGLNLPMWQSASTERLTAEVKRRLEIQDVLREQWKVLD